MNTKKIGKKEELSDGNNRMVEQDSPKASPWSSEISEDSTGAEGRKRWRKAMEPIVNLLYEDFLMPQEMSLRNAQLLKALVLGLTLKNPEELVKFKTKFYQGWFKEMGVEEKKSFKNSSCLDEDRRELISWLGDIFTKRDWIEQGPNFRPIAFDAVTQLMRHWTVIIWQANRGKPIPDTCIGELSSAGRHVFYTQEDRKAYLPPEEIQMDMHTFFYSWGRARTIIKDESCPEVKRDTGECMDLNEILFCLRYLAVIYPNQVRDDDVISIKTMISIMDTPPLVEGTAHILSAMEDRGVLEESLRDIPEPVERVTKARGLRKL